MIARHLLAVAPVGLALLCAATVALAPAPPSATAQFGGSCFGEFEADDVPQRPGPRLRYGIGPRVKAGQVGGAPAPAVPPDRRKTLAALDRLRAERTPFVLRLNRFFWKHGADGIRRFERMARRYAREGYGVELQLRYHPSARQEGDIPAWTRYVRRVVRRFGEIRRVKAVQVTNEVNVEFSRDSSDGGYRRAKAALVRGVIAAQDETREHDFDHLEIGFNWFYRTDPDNERDFWTYLRDRGGERFIRSVDWIGLDAYPGTFFPPVEPPGEERDGMVNAMSTLRCLARIPDIPRRVPMHVEENGWPTGPGRPPERQAQALRTMVRAVHDFRGTYNVTDYRWFNLRDADSNDPRFTQQYGILRSDYSEKPAFDVYCRLVARLSTRRGESCGD